MRVFGDKMILFIGNRNYSDNKIIRFALPSKSNETRIHKYYHRLLNK